MNNEQRLDSKTCSDLKRAAHDDPGRLAHLEHTSAPRAGAWLHATPSPSTRNNMDPLLFRTSILSWLRVPLMECDTICPLCDGILDKFGDHSLVCPCGGDRTKRHNLLRNHSYHFAASAGLNPELEKPGLLQPRPFVGPSPENGVRCADPAARRPGDIYLPRWRRGTPLALDFAVTSGMRNVAAVLPDASTVLTSYEDFKRSHLNTAFSCSAEGFFFAPVVVEARGGAWGPAAVKVFSELAKAKSMITGEPVATLLTHLYQGLGVILHRENARAALKRMRRYTQDAHGVLSAATVLQSSAAAAADDTTS